MNRMTAMTFIVTAGGDELDLQLPQRGHITAWSIAWSLAQLNRFNGHAIRPYSVAEHSLLVCEIAEREFGLDAHGLLAAHLHDAHEAFCGDIVSPAKPQIGPGWAQYELRWERLVHSSFAVMTASAVNRDAIQRADLIALATERRDLMPRTPSPWSVLAGIEPVSWVDLYSPERRAMGWGDWRDRWLDRYHELEYARDPGLLLLVPATTWQYGGDLGSGPAAKDPV